MTWDRRHHRSTVINQATGIAQARVSYLALCVIGTHSGQTAGYARPRKEVKYIER